MAEDVVVDVELPNGQVVMVRARPLDEVALVGGTPQDVGLAEQLASFSDVTDVLTGVGQSILAALEMIAPSKASVEFGLELALRGGKLVSVFVDAGGTASLKIILEWERSSKSNVGN